MNKFEEFYYRLDAELESHTSAWSKMQPDELIMRSKEISAIRDAYEHLTDPECFSLDAIEALLIFPDTLQAVADKLTECRGDFWSALPKVYQEAESLQHDARVLEMPPLCKEGT